MAPCWRQAPARAQRETPPAQRGGNTLNITRFQAVPFAARPAISVALTCLPPSVTDAAHVSLGRSFPNTKIQPRFSLSYLLSIGYGNGINLDSKYSKLSGDLEMGTDTKRNSDAQSEYQRQNRAKTP